MARFVGQALAAAALWQGGSASAMGLLQAYQAALINDPTYQSALQEALQGREYENLGRSGLLPNLSANYNASKNKSDQETNTILGRRNNHQEYISRTSSVTLRQSLFNLDSMARYRQGKAQSAFSEMQLVQRQQELILRVSSAYIDALFSNAQVRLATVQRDMYAEQRKVNDRLFAKGEGTRTDMLETQARLDLAEAQLLEAGDNRQTALATLAGIVGQDVESLDELSEDFRIGAPDGEKFEAWKAQAVANNPELGAQAFAIEAAKQEISKARSGHAPRVDLVGSYSKNASESINYIGQDSTVRGVGIQVSIPLYSGGYVNASTRQAVAGHERAKAELQLKTDKVMVELRKQYAARQSSVSRILALEKAVASGKLLLTATEQSIKGGVRINLDLLNAQQQLFTSQRDLAQARYNYLLSNLRLRAAAGTLGEDDIRQAAAYFR
ncbi:TolC family outer membrane protein [Massilia sp. erpn]|nr:TolC family outer membrane protein [Massilia sp. erpn]